MSHFDDGSRIAAHNACGDACRDLTRTPAAGAAVCRARVEWDGCQIMLTVTAEYFDGGAADLIHHNAFDRPR